MFQVKLRVTLVVFICSMFGAWADDKPIDVGGISVHPTRVLAKFARKGGINAQQLHANAVGYVVQRQIEQIPRLSVLDTATVPVQGPVNNAADALMDRINTLRATGEFEYVEPDIAYHISLVPNDSRFLDGTLWGLRNQGQQGGKAGADINAVPAWDITTGSTNIIVAVTDTGIRYTHQDLAAQMWVNSAEIPGNGIDDDGDGYIDDVYGINAFTGSGDPMDDHGHGSHCAGTIGAAANDNHPHVGVAWKVRLMALKCFDSQGSGFSTTEIDCINYAVKHGAQIISASWGGRGFSQALYDSISNARKNGVLFVAAAGNDGVDNDKDPHYPSSFDLDNIISVAALDRSDKLADFSNYGLVSVDIGAPGVDIFSCWMDSDTSYNIISGTSMATPHVSGVAALVWGQNTNRSMVEVRTRILRSAVPIPALAGKVTTGGRANVFRALQGEADGNMELTISPPKGVFMPANTLQPVFVSVSDDLDVTNATVVGTIASVSTNIVFLNDGKAPDTKLGDGTYTALIAVPTAGPFTLNLSITAPGKQPLQTNITYLAVALPANDDFAKATKIKPTGAILHADNRLATLEVGEPVHAGVASVTASLWYVWSSLTTTPAVVDTAGSSFDAVLAVYRGTSLTGLTPVASADDVGGRKRPYVNFTAEAGVTYYIAVAGKTNLQTSVVEVGDVQLRVEPNGAVDTTPPTVRVMQPISGTVIQNATGKVEISGTALDPQPNASGIAPNGVFVSVNGSIPSSALGTTTWTNATVLSPGINTIKVYCVDNSENQSDTVTITVVYQKAIGANDLFATATELTGTSKRIQGDNSLAGKETGEPNHAGNEGGKSLWFVFTAPANGVLLLSTETSSFDTLLGLYTGRFVSDLTEVDSNDDAYDGSGFSEIVHAVDKGQVYHIALDGFAGASGTAILQFTFSETGVFPVTVDGSVGGSVSPGSGSFPAGATVTFTAVPDPYYQFDHFETSQGVFTKNPLALTIKGATTVSAVFADRKFTDGFETGDFSTLPWISKGWEVESKISSRGQFAAGTLPIADRQTNSLTVMVDLLGGIGNFEYRVSTETNYDRLDFFVNGELRNTWSGEIPWSGYSFETPSGPVALEWRYTKDNALSSGLDAVFIDNLDLPLSKPIAARPSLKITKSGAGRSVSFLGQAAQTYTVEVSTNLKVWSTLTTVTADSNGNASFQDAGAGLAYRFYRVRTP